MIATDQGRGTEPGKTCLGQLTTRGKARTPALCLLRRPLAVSPGCESCPETGM